MKKCTPIRLFCLLIVSLCVLFAQLAPAQQHSIDSLRKLLSSYNNTDSIRTALLINISAHFQTSNLKEAESYAKEGLHVAENTKDGNLICAALSQLGSVYCWQRKSASSLKIYFRQKELGSLLADKYWLQDAYLGISYVYESENDWNKAMQYTLKAIPYAE